MSAAIKRVAIIGMGLMGGSLGLALKRSALPEVRVYARRDETRRLVVEMGAADVACESPIEALHGADMVVFCLPVCSIPDAVRDCLPAYQPGCIITDVGSTKAELVASLEQMLCGSGAIYVGSHPMAGSEKSGMEHARADLYKGTVTAVTPSVKTPDYALKAVAQLWEGVGSRVVRLSPERHDKLVARTSHLPHLTAALLAATVGREMDNEVPLFCGAGFRDSTRVASGAPEMWRDIVKSNEESILGELKAFDQSLRDLITSIENKDYDAISRFLAAARQSRRDLLGN